MGAYLKQHFNAFITIVGTKPDMALREDSQLREDRNLAVYWQRHSDLMEKNRDYVSIFNSYARARKPVDWIMDQGNRGGPGMIVMAVLASSPFLRYMEYREKQVARYYDDLHPE